MKSQCTGLFNRGCMKKILRKYLLILTLCWLLPTSFLLSVELSFLEMMGQGKTGINPCKNQLKECDLQEMHALEVLYKQNISAMSKKDGQKIPKILHFIWLGPKPFPSESIKNLNSWRKYHPDWEMYFWTDSLFRPCPIAGMQKKLVHGYDFSSMQKFIKATPNWGEKSDIMRYIIIQNMGGFYVDHDVECMHSFSPLLAFDFVACCEQPQPHKGANNSFVLPNNALFGAAPKHPILAKTLKKVILRWHDLDKRFPENGKSISPWKVIYRTFDSFVLATKEELQNKNYTNIVLPTCYFFPDRILSPNDIQNFQRKGIIWASHKYAMSWVQEEWIP